MRIEQNYSLINHHTFHLPVKTRWFMEYDTEDELSRILHDDTFRKHRFLSIGEGSNMLFLRDFDGVVLHSRIQGIALSDEDADSVLIQVGAGVLWDDVVDFAVSKGWGGIENLSFIPGAAGAAAAQNIGAYGVEIKDVIETVTTIHPLSGKKQVFSNEACRYNYRFSFFKAVADVDPLIITSICLRLQKRHQYKLDYGNLTALLNDRPISLSSIRETIIDVRRSKLPDPSILGNVGSFFINPVISRSQYEQLKLLHPSIPSYEASNDTVKIPAAWLIEQCGFKGHRSGPVGTYEKHALIIVNYGGATSADILSFAQSIIHTVNNTFGITLIPEVKIND